ncbi:CASP C terminal-domain-containing protein [Phycomyces blakesleeanus]|uniref:Protein CASP n=1 Tax=Phycomyces blakesleeanus TaxID=4837 RepID=A0ABR3AQV3_PHYBL
MTTLNDSSFATAIQFWKGVHLPELQKELDQQGLAVVENQKDGLVSRKKLAEQTREFRKIPDEEKLSQFKSLLKGYQSEIDNITRRTKYSENAFLTLYKLLVNAPDPAPLFEAAVDQSAKAVENDGAAQENKRLQQELKEANEKLAKLQTVEKANLDLKAALTKLETVGEEKRAEDVSQKEQDVKQQYADKIKSYKEREHGLQRQLNQALDQLTQLRHTHDDTQAQLLDHDQKYGKCISCGKTTHLDEEVVGKLAELDIVTMDLERANTTIANLERKLTQIILIESELNGVESHQTGLTWCSAEDLVETEKQDAEMAKLIKDVETYKNLLQKTDTRLNKRIKDLSNEVKALAEERDLLAKKLKECEDYDEVKRELAIMKYVEFANNDEDSFDAKDVLNKEDNAIRKSLEVQLMEKSKRLETDYTQLKMSFSDLQNDLQARSALCEELQAKTYEQTGLIQKLEEDLARVGQKQTTDVSESFSRPSSSNNLAAIGSMTSTRPSLEVVHRQSQDTIGGGKDDKSILPIVMGQRDRFRQRNTEMEEQARNMERKLQEMESEMEGLKEDNLKLYERLRFVHVWKDEQSKDPSPRNFKKNGPRNGTIQDEDPTDKYGKIYEETMNPFMQFHRKEETRRYHALNPAEKLSYNVTRVLFSHKWSRYFLIFYALMLHLLVVVTLYQLSLWECRHDHEEINMPTVKDDTAAFMPIQN